MSDYKNELHKMIIFNYYTLDVITETLIKHLNN